MSSPSSQPVYGSAGIRQPTTPNYMANARIPTRDFTGLSSVAASELQHLGIYTRILVDIGETPVEAFSHELPTYYPGFCSGAVRHANRRCRILYVPGMIDRWEPFYRKELLSPWHYYGDRVERPYALHGGYAIIGGHASLGGKQLIPMGNAEPGCPYHELLPIPTNHDYGWELTDHLVPYMYATLEARLCGHIDTQWSREWKSWYQGEWVGINALVFTPGVNLGNLNAQMAWFWLSALLMDGSTLYASLNSLSPPVIAMNGIRSSFQAVGTDLISLRMAAVSMGNQNGRQAFLQMIDRVVVRLVKDAIDEAWMRRRDNEQTGVVLNERLRGLRDSFREVVRMTLVDTLRNPVVAPRYEGLSLVVCRETGNVEGIRFPDGLELLEDSIMRMPRRPGEPDRLGQPVPAESAPAAAGGRNPRTVDLPDQAETPVSGTTAS